MSDKAIAHAPVAVSVLHASKDFALPHEKVNSVKGMFTSLLHSHGRTVEVQHALKDVTFQVYEGEFFGIVGRNGSGKSTLLKLLAGIYQPNHGSITISGKLVPFIELGVGFNAELTGRENVYLNGALLGFSTSEMDAMYAKIVDFAELHDFMDQKLKNYSSGMQIRLAFSLAIRAKADILLVDEVLAVGDADFQRKCFDYFRELKKSKTTVIFISHDMDAVKEYCDRAVLINDGKVITEDKPTKVAQAYMKQFNQVTDSDAPSTDSKSKRWGDKSLVIERVTAKLGSDGLRLSLLASLQQPLDHPVLGFVIKNQAGTEILGTNTYISGAKLPELKVGESLEVSWMIPDLLGDGRYSIDAAAHHQAGSPVYDWREAAATFVVKKGRHSYYPVSPNFKVAVNKS